jgi:hypothetical protein
VIGRPLPDRLGSELDDERGQAHGPFEAIYATVARVVRASEFVQDWCIEEALQVLLDLEDELLAEIKREMKS